MTQQIPASLTNYIGGAWQESKSTTFLDVINPATSEPLAHFALADTGDVSRAVDAAAKAYPAWRRTPPQDRIQYLFRFRELLLKRIDDIARAVTKENGKTLAEAKAEIQREQCHRCASITIRGSEINT